MRSLLPLLVLALLIHARGAPAATITCPANITVSSSPNTCTAQVNYPPPTVSGGVFLGCDPASSSAFPVGTTIVSCAALDPTPGQFGVSCDFAVTVVDTQPPSIVCPDDVDTGSDEDACGARIEFEPTAADQCPGVTTQVESGLFSGSVFPVGVTRVQLKATDASGNTASCSFQATVADTVAPRITCPADIVVPTPGPVEYEVSAEDACEAVEVTFSQPSGSIFRGARTVVGATARDVAGNETACTFAVLVGASTTSTTVPPQTGCPTAPTFASVGCRLAQLEPALSAAASEPARQRLGRLLGRAIELVGKAEALQTAGRRRATRAALRKAIARLGRFQKKVLATKSTVPEPVRSAVAGEAEAVREDLRALEGS